MNLPLVSVICLCYNHKPFVAAAIRSALTQTYKNIELIVVDDGSTDGSKEEIRKVLAGTSIEFIDLKGNIGNCAAFNRGLRRSKGEYVIDLAADDLLLPKRVEEGVNDFANAPVNSGVHFSDAFIINETGNILRTHYRRNTEGQIIQEVPSGNIYKNLISRYFISPPTMMMKRSVFEYIGGYDESLSYEDFDFWIRSARRFEYIFNKAPLVKRRLVRNSLSVQQFAFRSKHAFSTLAVCRKIYELNSSEEEDAELIKRCRYEIRQCAKTFNLNLIPKYFLLMNKTRQRLLQIGSNDRL